VSKSDAARLQTISFVGTRFLQFVLLRDLENGEYPFRPHAGKDGVKEQTFWDRFLNAVTDHKKKNELDSIFEGSFKEPLPGDWQQVKGHLMFDHIQNLRSQLQTNAETMIATTFHRRIRDGLHLQLLTSRIRLGVELNNQADMQLSSELAGAITCKEAWQFPLPSELDEAVSKELRAFLMELATAMETLPVLTTPKYVKAEKRFYDFLKVTQIVQKHRVECIDPLSDEQLKKIPRSLKKSMAVLPLSSPSVPCVTLTPTVLKQCYHKILGHHGAQTLTDEGLFNYFFPGLQDFKKKVVEVCQPHQDGRVLGLILFSRPKSESGTANVRKVLNLSLEHSCRWKV